MKKTINCLLGIIISLMMISVDLPVYAEEDISGQETTAEEKTFSEAVTEEYSSEETITNQESGDEEETLIVYKTGGKWYVADWYWY
mgnify:CR=1 FL=1